METSDQKDKRGMGRREFIKISAKGTAALVAAPLVENPVAKGLSQLAQSLEPRIPLQKEEWTRERVLTNPLEFIDHFSRQMVKTVGKDNLSNHQLELLHFFSLEFSNDNKSYVERRRESIRKGYELYGKQINRILDKIETVGEETRGVLQGYLSSFYIFWKPLVNLHERLKENRNFTIDREWGDLLTLSSRFYILNDSYEGQKSEIIKSGRKLVEDSNLDENIEQVWRLLIRYRKIEGTDDKESHHGKEEFELFRKWILIHKEYLPLALIGFGYVGIGDVRRGGYYPRGQLSGGAADDIEARGGFFDMLNAKKEYDSIEKRADMREDLKQQRLESINRWAQFAADDASIVFLHELAHRLDPQNDPFNFYYLHPGDQLDYIESYADMLSSFFKYLDNHPSGKEMEQWFYDPISPKTFGIDEITSSGQLTTLNWEIDMIIEIASFLETDPPLQELAKKRKLDWLFKKRGEDLINWKLRLGNQQEDGYFNRLYNGSLYDLQKSPKSKSSAARFSSFAGITKKHLEEMKQITREAYNRKDDSILALILEMKSLYIFASYALLRDAAKEGIIMPNHKLYQHYRNLESLVAYHLVHCMTGPIDEYLPIFPTFDLTLHLQPSQLAKFSIIESDIVRGENSSYFKRPTTEIINGLHQSASKISSQRAKMWGADPNKAKEGQESDIYTQIAFDVTRNFLKLPNLPFYGPPLG